MAKKKGEPILEFEGKRTGRPKGSKDDMHKWLMENINDPKATRVNRPGWTEMLRAIQADKSLKSWYLKQKLTAHDNEFGSAEEEKPSEPAAVLIDELLAQWENEPGKVGNAVAEIAELKAKVKSRDEECERLTQMIEGYQAKEKSLPVDVAVE